MAMLANDNWYVSRDDFLTSERLAETRHEWVDGVVYNMAGASRRHIDVVGGLIERLRPIARALGCFVGSNDLMVETADACYYPDVIVTCEPSDDDYVERRPCFIVEVLSPSTKRQDRHEKRDAYCALDSMRDYWIVDTDRYMIEVWHRHDDGPWNGRHFSGDEPLPPTCLGPSPTITDIVGLPPS